MQAHSLAVNLQSLLEGKVAGKAIQLPSSLQMQGTGPTPAELSALMELAHICTVAAGVHMWLLTTPVGASVLRIEL